MSYARALIQDGQLNRAVAPGDTLILGEVIGTNAVAGASTLTALMVASGILYRSGPTANFTDTTDTAANMIAQLVAQYNYTASATSGIASGVGVQNGSTFRLKYINSVAFVATIAAGVGVTLGYNATTVNASSVKEFLITVLNGTPQQSFAANVTNGSAVVTGLTQFQTSQITAGMLVTGAGIPGGTTVAGVVSGVGVTLSANATASNVQTVLQFSPQVRVDGLGQGLL